MFSVNVSCADIRQGKITFREMHASGVRGRRKAAVDRYAVFQHAGDREGRKADDARGRKGSLIALQHPLSPIRVFARGIGFRSATNVTSGSHLCAMKLRRQVYQGVMLITAATCTNSCTSTFDQGPNSFVPCRLCFGSHRLTTGSFVLASPPPPQLAWLFAFSRQAVAAATEPLVF